jgi:hypothetical protein
MPQAPLAQDSRKTAADLGHTHPPARSTGSCGYGYIDKNVGTGWDVAALSDSVFDFGGHCGCVL